MSPHVDWLSFSFAYSYVLVSCAIGLAFGYYNWMQVDSVNTVATAPTYKDKDRKTEEEKRADQLYESNKVLNSTAVLIQNWAKTFLLAEYVYIIIFVGFFTIVLILVDGFRVYTAFAFVLWAATSVASGYIGMHVATRTNLRVTFLAASGKSSKLQDAFTMAFRGGAVMGFCLVSLALAVLTVLIFVYLTIMSPRNTSDFTRMFECIAGYGLGGSCVALFCRVGGGIYTKAADVGADLVGKVVNNLKEDSPENPATIADNVGDNVGDIAGMGSDLFGSFAESTCAALIVSGTSVEFTTGANFFYPLVLSAAGILVCIVTSFFATGLMELKENKDIERVLSAQLVVSTVLLLPTIYFVSHGCLPATILFTSWEGAAIVKVHSTSTGIMVCAMFGLVCGLLIGYFTDYYTSNANQPVQDLAQACKSGAAINIIHGLALGYLSCIIPILSIAVTIFVSFKLAGMYGIAIAALGMLSNLATSLAIDGYGPISDNAGGLAEMSEFPEEVRHTTDALDAAGNTTAAVGKWFAIGSACLVSLALFGAFVTRTGMTVVNILEPIQISSLLVGAMIPYAFSAMTMKSVGLAA